MKGPPTMATNNCPSPQGPEDGSVLAGTQGAVRTKATSFHASWKGLESLLTLGSQVPASRAGRQHASIFLLCVVLFVSAATHTKTLSAVRFPGTHCTEG